jgi:hypothetical protein
MSSSETSSSHSFCDPHPYARQKQIREWMYCLGIALGAIYAYSYRFAMSPDGIGYLDVAAAYVRQDWPAAINSWWSPAYSWILAIFLRIFSPTSRTELPLLHLVNFLCFAWTAWCFHRFWQALLDSIEKPEANLAGLPFLTPLALDLFGYGLFFFLFLPLIATPTPDVFASSFMFLIAERILRCKTIGRISWHDAVTIGLLIAFGYLAKAILLYFGLAAIGTAAVDYNLRNRRALLVSSVVLFVAIAPWMVALHHSFGRWTLGAAGPLNYAWFVDGTRTGTFPGPAGAPLPYFPGNQIFNQPAIYAVPTQPNITYVPWYDPGRFDRSDRARFQWRGQIGALQKNLRWLGKWLFLNLGPMSVAVLGLLLLSGTATAVVFIRYLAVAVPSLFVIALYSLVYIRTQRYIVGMAVLLFAVILAAVRIERKKQVLVRAILVSGLIIFTLTSVPGVLITIEGVLNRGSDPTVELAEALNHAGISANSRVGTVGTGLYAYWAHLARVNVAAEMWDEDTPLFWNASLARRNAMLCVMGEAGSSAVIGHPPQNVGLSGWEPLGNSGYWMRRVSEQDCRQN